AGQRVVAEAAVDDVVTSIALDGVDEAVAVEIDRISGGMVHRAQRLDLLAVAESVAEAGEHAGESAAADGLFDDIVRIIDVIRVVAAEPDHGIGAALAVDGVGVAVAGDRLRELVAGQGEPCRVGVDVPARSEKLDLLSGTERVARTGED